MKGWSEEAGAGGRLHGRSVSAPHVLTSASVCLGSSVTAAGGEREEGLGGRAGGGRARPALRTAPPPSSPSRPCLAASHRSPLSEASPPSTATSPPSPGTCATSPRLSSILIPRFLDSCSSSGNFSLLPAPSAFVFLPFWCNSFLRSNSIACTKSGEPRIADSGSRQCPRGRSPATRGKCKLFPEHLESMQQLFKLCRHRSWSPVRW